MQPHRQQPTRLLRPWDSPGKNTGVGCHVLLQCMKVKNESEVAQSSESRFWRNVYFCPFFKKINCFIYLSIDLWEFLYPRYKNLIRYMNYKYFISFYGLSVFLSQLLFSHSVMSNSLSVTQSCPTLCDPMDCSMPVFPVLHYLLEFAQTHVHWVDDAIQPSYPLSPLSSPALNLFQHKGVFQWVGSLQQVAKVLELQPKYQSFQYIFGDDFL